MIEKHNQDSNNLVRFIFRLLNSVPKKDESGMVTKSKQEAKKLVKFIFDVLKEESKVKNQLIEEFKKKNKLSYELSEGLPMGVDYRVSPYNVPTKIPSTSGSDYREQTSNESVYNVPEGQDSTIYNTINSDTETSDYEYGSEASWSTNESNNENE